MLRKLLLAGLLAAFLAVPASASAATSYCGPANAKTAIIVIHGGSFVYSRLVPVTPDDHGNSLYTGDTCDAFAAKGWRVINLDYPLADLNGAYNDLSLTTAVARANYANVLAYGESAGGGLASLAAAKGWVKATYAWAPVSNLTTWQTQSFWNNFKDPSMTARRKLSAYYSVSSKSTALRVIHGRSDATVPVKQSRDLKTKYSKMTLIEKAGGHQPYELSFKNATADAITYFKSLRY